MTPVRPAPHRSLPRRLGGAVYRAGGAVAHLARRTIFRRRRRRPLYESSILDDLIFAQPLNVWCRWERARARRRPEHEGVSVVIVNYNTLELIKVVLAAVRLHSPAGTEIIVVDNASTDGSREWLRGRPHGCRPVALRANLGHGRALDIGLFRATTSVVVTLDSDAFPYATDWLDTLLAPLRSPDIQAAGCWGPRDRLHPACAAYRRATVIGAATSFGNFNLHKDLGEDPDFGVNTWDTGELLFEHLGRAHVQILQVEQLPYGGWAMAGVVYHHTAMTTRRADEPGADPDTVADGWGDAVRELLPTIHRQT